MTIPYNNVSFYSKSGNIEDELGISNPSRLDLNDSRVRTLTGYSGSGSYNDMSALRGKSSFTPTTYTLTTSSSGSFTVPNFCTKIQVLMIGGGGVEEVMLRNHIGTVAVVEVQELQQFLEQFQYLQVNQSHILLVLVELAIQQAAKVQTEVVHQLPLQEQHTM